MTMNIKIFNFSKRMCLSAFLGASQLVSGDVQWPSRREVLHAKSPFIEITISKAMHEYFTETPQIFARLISMIKHHHLLLNRVPGRYSKTSIIVFWWGSHLDLVNIQTLRRLASKMMLCLRSSVLVRNQNSMCLQPSVTRRAEYVAQVRVACAHISHIA